MLNFTYIPASGNSRYEFKNIFNQLGKTAILTVREQMHKVIMKRVNIIIRSPPTTYKWSILRETYIG